MQPQPRYDQQVQPRRDDNVRPANYDQYGPTEKDKKVVPFDKAKFQKNLEQTFGADHLITNKENYRDALFNAAEKGKPVVMMFGRGSDPETQKNLEAMQRAKQANGDKAEFCFIDLDKVDPNSKIGQYSAKEIDQKFGSPFTMVFNQHQGEGNTPVRPDKPSHWQRGALNEQSLAAGINDAYAKQQEVGAINTGRESKPEAEKKKDADDKTKPPVDDPSKALAKKIISEVLDKPFNKQNFDELFKGLDPKAREKACLDAIDMADQFAKERSLDGKLGAQVRAAVGFAFISWGEAADKAGDKATAAKQYERGATWMLLAGERNPGLYDYPSFQQALRDSKLPGNAADFILEEGKKNATWFYPTQDELRQNPKAREESVERLKRTLQAEMAKPRKLRGVA